MRRISLVAVVLLTCLGLKAQWVNDPAANTFIANCTTGAGEVLVSNDPASGDTYVQWLYGADNGWSPWVQRLNDEGVPQWPADGIHITTPNLATWSPGYALAAVEGGVVSMFRTADAHHWVVKINADGTLPWGEHGKVLFNGKGGGRSEMIAGDDGGVWTLGTDMDSTFLQYVDADGTLRNSVTIKDPAKKCSNGILIPSGDHVFVVYSKHTIQGYTTYNKEIYVAGYNKDGEQIVPETLLFGQQSVNASYIHYAISDGNGGGYVFQWHKNVGNAFNIYVTHFNANGAPTILNPDGVAVHSTDPGHYYTSAYATIDPASNDLIIAYRQTDSDTQTQDMVLMNCITPDGDKIWNEGLAVTDAIGNYADILVGAFEYGEGFAVIYKDGNNAIKSAGYDMQGNPLWNTVMSRTSYTKSISENCTGFNQGQNIIAWVNTSTGGVYGQNIGWDGTMGSIEPPIPPTPCDPPANFKGEYIYTEVMFGVMVSWDAPEITPHHYNLYRDGDREVIEIEPEFTSYFEELGIGDYVYRLTAVYEDCESDYALTETGDNYLFISVTGVSESVDEEIVSITKIYTLNGQVIRNANHEELSRGVYIIQGLTSNGKLTTKKLIIK